MGGLKGVMCVCVCGSNAISNGIVVVHMCTVFTHIVLSVEGSCIPSCYVIVPSYILNS